jgi:hypothetical protein
VVSLLIATSAGASTPGLGKPAKDGAFTFVATALRCNIHNVGGMYGATASGQYCAVNIRVSNHTNSQGTFDVTAQIAFDSRGRKYPGDSTADIYSGHTLFLKSVNPGISIAGTLYFDMPKGDRPAYFMFHDSAFSGGVKVKAK